MGGKTTTHAMIDRIISRNEQKKKATSASEIFFKFLVAVLRRCSLIFFLSPRITRSAWRAWRG